MRKLRTVLLVICTHLLWLLCGVVANGNKPKHEPKGQTQPSTTRVAEIQKALKEHGFTPGTTWEETQEITRQIADQHLWQTDHAPDARVLIMLGLGGKNADPCVLEMQDNHLDIAARKEAARKAAAAGK